MLGDDHHHRWGCNISEKSTCDIGLISSFLHCQKRMLWRGFALAGIDVIYCTDSFRSFDQVPEHVKIFPVERYW